MKTLSKISLILWATIVTNSAAYGAISAVFMSLTFADSFVNSPTAIAQSVTATCPQLTNRRYLVILNRPVNQLPQLPEFLAIAAVPCNYLNNSMTFFGGFDNAQGSTFRANQLQQLGLDAVVHSFSAKITDVPENFRASMILVELNNEPSLVIQQVQAITGKSALLATFNNRSVVLVAPLSSPQNANAIAAKLRNYNLAAQVVSASLLAFPPTASSNPANPLPDNSVPNPRNPKSSSTIYRVLVPNIDGNTLKQLRESAPDAFLTVFKGKSYIQVRTYKDRGNAHRERDRLNARFAGTILLQD